MINRVTN